MITSSGSKATSPFTVHDSVDTPHHSGVSEEHHNAQQEGGVNKGARVGEVVFGPGAFGSPDPATLAHTLLTNGDEMVAADTAPTLADDYATNSGLGTLDDTELEKMNKDELVNYAKQRGLDTKGMNKGEILDALKNDSDGDGDADDEVNDSMTKEELLAHAEANDVKADDSMTKAEILDAINNG